MLTIGNTQLKLLEKLCNACAVSGDEGEVRQIVLEEIKGRADSVKVDALGNVLAVKKGTAKNRLRVMVSAHMDEVGFMLVADDGEGLYRFETVGGMDVRHLVGKPVWVGRDHTPGVIGARPIHLTTADERKKSIPLDQLRIDLGPGGKAKLGDRAAFATKFQRSGPAIIAKALDNRLGVVTLIELLKNAPPNIDLLAAFTVQEELGLRGAKVAAHAFDPDLAVAIDATPANDLPSHDGEENTAYNTKLGLGPAIYIADGSTFSDPRLVRHFVETAEAGKIPYQFRQPGGGGTDAGSIHKERAGIPSLSVSAPHRYSHTAASIARLDDWKNYAALIHAALSRITPGLLLSERE
ncbi:MAG: endoglucanase [Anaerolineaceae bacterium]|nr:MAG: endoglucanase [Anaerolineaceae bacterium]